MTGLLHCGVGSGSLAVASDSLCQPRRALTGLPLLFSSTATGLRSICPALFHTQLSTQESYCHETLDFLGSSILVTQSSNLFLEGASRCPWQRFSWQCCSIAIQEHLVVLYILTRYWKIRLFLPLFLVLALGMAWLGQRKTLAPLNWL